MKNEVTRNNDKIAEDNLEVLAEKYNEVGAKVMGHPLGEINDVYHLIIPTTNKKLGGVGHVPFDPWHNIAHAMMVLREMVKREWKYNLKSTYVQGQLAGRPERNEVRAYLRKESKGFIASSSIDHPEQAIMKAVSKAMEEEK